MKIIQATIFSLLLSTGCSFTYDKFVAADGYTYYGYDCSDYYDCMRTVYAKCDEDAIVVSNPFLALHTYPAPMQVYSAGTLPLEKGSGRIVFRCDEERIPQMNAEIQAKIAEVREKLNEDQIRRN